MADGDSHPAQASAQAIQKATASLLIAMADDASRFEAAYDFSRPSASTARKFRTLRVAIEGNLTLEQRNLEAMRQAATIAANEDFLTQILLALLRDLREDHAPEPRIEAMLEAVSALDTGVHHAITNRLRGLSDIDLLLKLIEVAQATCIIKSKSGKRVGTGFRVGDDLILTSAHVLSQAAPRDAQGIIDVTGVSCEFRNRLGSATAFPIQTFLSNDDWNVSGSQPCGQPPNMTPLAQAQNALNQLDYQLLRLAAPLGAALPMLNINSPAPVPNPLDRVHIIGHPGGDDCKYDANDVTQIVSSAGRFFHDVNTVPGMSGAPCVNNEGRVVALHEGAEKQLAQSINRAVLMQVIGQAISTARQNAFAPKLAYSPWLQDEEARKAWARAALTLCGSDAGALARWRSSIAEVGDSDPEGPGRPGDAYHPYFLRADTEAWCRAAAAADPASRVLGVHGAVGVGKSFTLSILRRHEPNMRANALTITPTMARAAAWDDLLAALGVEAIQDALALRPSDSALARDVYPQLFESLLERRQENRAAPFYLALDCGDARAWHAHKEKWPQLIASALKLLPLRVLIMGPSAVQLEELAIVLSDQTKVTLEQLNHVGKKAFRDQLAEARATFGAGTSEQDANANAAAEAALDNAETQLDDYSVNWPDLRTAEAVRISLALRAHTLQGPAP